MRKEQHLENNKIVSWKSFLGDVFICSLGSYGGPEAHFGVFTDQMVIKKKYLTEKELIELIALTGILPGPSSTQTLVAIGYKVGGPLLALITLLVWALPSLIVMTLLSFLSQFLVHTNISQDGLRYIGPMAVGFIILAAYRIGRKVVTDKVTFALLLFGGITTYFVRAPWIYPLVLVLGGAVSIIASKENSRCDCGRGRYIFTGASINLLCISNLGKLKANERHKNFFARYYCSCRWIS